MKIHFEREIDGRWIAEIPRMPGVLAYGQTKQDALRKVRAIALHTIADSVEQGSTFPSINRLFTHGVARN